jgi:hypothetical protein
VPTTDVVAAATDAGLSDSEVDAIGEQYADSQLRALKGALLVAGFIVLGSFAFTGHLPTKLAGGEGEGDGEGEDDRDASAPTPEVSTRTP